MAGVTAQRRSENAVPGVPQAPALDQRIVAWPEESLISRACPVCASTGGQVFMQRPDGLPVARCACCDMVFLPVVPSPDALTRFYDRYSDTHQRWQSSKGLSQALAAAQRRRGGNGILLELASRRSLAGKALLEVGCSRGSFLLDARHAGMAVSGVEIDRSARAFAAQLGFACHGDLDDAARSGPYDFIVALNVIEHLPDPRGWLMSLSGMLKPKGMLVLWTPNGGQAAVLGAGWVGFRVDLDHLNYFSQQTLSRLLVECGLWPEASWELSQANLAGFTGAEHRDRGRLARLIAWLRPPSRSWAIPPGAGAFTLGIFAGKP